MSLNNKCLFGPSGNSESFFNDGFSSSKDAPLWIKKFGLDLYEYSCGNGIRGSDEIFKEIGDAAKLANIKISIHAPYYISLSSIDEEKRNNSIKYIEETLKIAELLQAKTIVVHAGSCAKINRDDAINYAKETLRKIAETVDTKNISIGLETMGKKNQLGTVDEIIDFCKISDCFKPVIDFGHLYARECGEFLTKKDDYEHIFEKISKNLGHEILENLHCHFSKIEYTKSGEKKHTIFSNTDFGPQYELFIESLLDYGVSANVICESAGTMAEDALTMKNYYKEISERK